MNFVSFEEARAAYAADAVMLAERGIVMPEVQSYTWQGMKQNSGLAMDALPSLTTQANSAVPAMLTTFIDPQVYEILFSPTKAAKIFGEVRKGTWVDNTTMFPTVENTGEVSSYDDYSENGNANANTNWPNRQAYLFQTILEYGELELERAGLAKINWVSQLEASAADILNRFSNLSYFFGISGLQNYGALNDPNLNAALTPAPKAYGGTAWVVNGVVKATANEIFTDIQSMVIALVNQSNGTIEEEMPMTLALAPAVKVALTQTNSYAVNVYALLKENFPNISIESAIQYGVVTASNPQGNAGGNLAQLIVKDVERQQTSFCAFNEKMRAHKLIPATSSYKQKLTSGTWGCVIRQPFAISQMLGI